MPCLFCHGQSHFDSSSKKFQHPPWVEKHRHKAEIAVLPQTALFAKAKTQHGRLCLPEPPLPGTGTGQHQRYPAPRSAHPCCRATRRSSSCRCRSRWRARSGAVPTCCRPRGSWPGPRAAWSGWAGTSCPCSGCLQGENGGGKSDTGGQGWFWQG